MLFALSHKKSRIHYPHLVLLQTKLLFSWKDKSNNYHDLIFRRREDSNKIVTASGKCTALVSDNQTRPFLFSAIDGK